MEHDVNYFKMPPLSARHLFFASAFSIAMAILYAEPAWFAARVSGSPLPFSGALLVGLVAALGYALSFYLPSRLHPESKLKRTATGGMVPFLATQWAIAALCIALSSWLCFYLTLTLSAPSEIASYRMLSWFFLKGLFGIVAVHGLVTYIRYVEYLYVRNEDQPIKILTITVSGGVFLLVLCLTLFLRDVNGLQQLNVLQNHELWGLHVYFRGFYWMSLTLWLYLWHIVCLADH